VKPTIVVEIEGGCVTRVVSDAPLEIHLIIRDFDNIKAGDADPIENIDEYDYELW
jgi:hypothetical protein